MESLHAVVLDSFRPFLSREFVPERTHDFLEDEGVAGGGGGVGEGKGGELVEHTGRYFDRTVNVC